MYCEDLFVVYGNLMKGKSINKEQKNACLLKSYRSQRPKENTIPDSTRWIIYTTFWSLITLHTKYTSYNAVTKINALFSLIQVVRLLVPQECSRLNITAKHLFKNYARTRSLEEDPVQYSCTL
jgi:hypothetical protein